MRLDMICMLFIYDDHDAMLVYQFGMLNMHATIYVHDDTWLGVAYTTYENNKTLELQDQFKRLNN